MHKFYGRPQEPISSAMRQLVYPASWPHRGDPGIHSLSFAVLPLIPFQMELCVL